MVTWQQSESSRQTVAKLLFKQHEDLHAEHVMVSENICSLKQYRVSRQITLFVVVVCYREIVYNYLDSFFINFFKFEICDLCILEIVSVFFLA